MISESSRAFLKDLGGLLQIPSILCIPTFIVIIVFQEWFALLPFAVLTVLSFGIGKFLHYSFRNSNKTVPGSSYALISLAWFIIPLLGSIPFYGVAVQISDANAQTAIFNSFNSAFFESMSGFTGTGLTMLNDSSQIPHVLQFWRSITEWIGGLGIIFIAVLILDTAHKSESLYQSEAMTWNEKNRDSYNKIKKMLWIYIIYTIASILIYYIMDMPLWEAINHGITVISTGGFTVTKNSFHNYNDSIKIASIVFIIIGSLSFKTHVLLQEKKFKSILAQTQLKYHLVLLLIFIAILFLVNELDNPLDVIFQATTTLGNCGFTTVDFDTRSTKFLFPILIAMFIGGNTSSTTGGLKTQRIAWLFKTFKENIRQSITPSDNKENYKFRTNYNGERIDNTVAYKQIRLASILLFVWITSITLGTLILSFILPPNHRFFDILFDVSSALNNMGLSTGLTNHELPTSAKWVLIILMWLGRLEVIGIIVMFAYFLGFNRTKAT